MPPEGLGQTRFRNDRTNDSGMIVGWGYYNGIARAFVAVPGTPPPPPEDPEYNP